MEPERKVPLLLFGIGGSRGGLFSAGTAVTENPQRPRWELVSESINNTSMTFIFHYLNVSLVLNTACPCSPVPCRMNRWLWSPWSGALYTSNTSFPRWRDMLWREQEIQKHGKYRAFPVHVTPTSGLTWHTPAIRPFDDACVALSGFVSLLVFLGSPPNRVLHLREKGIKCGHSKTKINHTWNLLTRKIFLWISMSSTSTTTNIFPYTDVVK